jgi:hypothetical protein
LVVIRPVPISIISYLCRIYSHSLEEPQIVVMTYSRGKAWAYTHGEVLPQLLCDEGHERVHHPEARRDARMQGPGVGCLVAPGL